MTAMWFGLAAIALVGAIVLLYFDRRQRQRSGHARQVWAKAKGYTYVSVEPTLASTWRRGALAKLGYLTAVDVVTGNRKGEKFVLFDLEDAATLVAVRRQIGSDIDVDMRLKTAAPPKDADLELLGAIGDRVVFATNPEIARHAIDQRMVAFIEALPETVQMLWSEGNWTLGMLPVGTASKDWEATIDAVMRLSGLLHVLPPESDSHGSVDTERPHPEPRNRRDSDDAEDLPRFRRQSGGSVDDYDDDRYDVDYYDDYYEDRLGADGFADERYEDERYQGFDAGPEPEDARAELMAERDPRDEPASDAPQRRPSLAVVPDARDDRGADSDVGDRDSEPFAGDSNREPLDDQHDATSRLPGGPFHPGFRPYQGPVPK